MAISTAADGDRGDDPLDVAVAVQAAHRNSRVTSADTSIEAGQKVQVWEGSANRDADVFDRADDFDIARKPNPHLGFGQGVHYCLGANLARLELRVLYEELLSRFGEVRVVRPVEWTRSNRHTGIRHLVVELG